MKNDRSLAFFALAATPKRRLFGCEILPPPPRVVAAFLTALALGFWISFESIRRPSALIWSDMEGYYVYLPAVFIYGGFENVAVADTGYLKKWPGTEKVYSKYTCGVAMMQTPFFLAAHFLAEPMGFRADGHSDIYCFALMLAGVFYMLSGLFLLFAICQRYYGRIVAGVSVLCLLFGTNLFYYSFLQPAMSHAFSFFLFSAMLFLSEGIMEAIRNDAFSTKISIQKAVLFGLVAGLLTLIRPTNAIALFLPFYQFIKIEKAQRDHFLRSNLKRLSIVFSVAVFIWIPQTIYWKTITGHWLMWSYAGESFSFWKEPRLFRVLFDAWNGWILYSPIVAVPLAWLVVEWRRRRNRHAARAILAIFSVAIFLFASWWAWWFGGAFGHRCFVEFLALLALPMAAATAELFEKRWKTAIFLPFLAFLIYWNIGLTYRYANGFQPWDGPAWTYERLWQEAKALF